MKRRLFSLFSFGVMLMVLLAACGGGQPQSSGGGEAEEASDGGAQESQDAGDAEDAGGALPGEGKTVSMGQANWDTGWFQVEIFTVLLEQLGYEVEDPKSLDNPAFYLSCARGEVDMWPNGWFPLHNTYMENEDVQGKVELVGYEVRNGALQGYLIDKATADQHGVASLEDFKDPEVAALFDGNGNGKADLIGCDPGWGCEAVIDHHIEAYELGDTVEHVQGSYSALMGDTVARFQRGQPILYYTWTPNWTVHQLKPNEDVVWIEVPFSSLPEEQKELEDQTTGEGIAGCVADPCNMGFPPNDIRVAANSEFLDANPAVERLATLVQIPLDDIASQNAKMFEGEDDDEDIRRHAEEWIAENQADVDMWINAAITGDMPEDTSSEEEGSSEEGMETETEMDTTEEMTGTETEMDTTEEMTGTE
jgi:glycine betaine/proline transport system substrate-binding protein